MLKSAFSTQNWTRLQSLFMLHFGHLAQVPDEDRGEATARFQEQLGPGPGSIHE